MSRENEQQPNEDGITLNQFIGIVFTVAHVWWLPWELVLRNRFGRRYIDGWLMAAALWPIVFSAFVFPQYPIGWSLAFFWIVILAGVFARWAAILRPSQEGIHSQYNGYPHLARYLRFDELVAKNYGEAFVCLPIAFLALGLNPSFAAYLFGGWVAGRVKHFLKWHYQREEDDDLRDAFIEQQAMAERFRRGG